MSQYFTWAFWTRLSVSLVLVLVLLVYLRNVSGLFPFMHLASSTITITTASKTQTWIHCGAKGYNNVYNPGYLLLQSKVQCEAVSEALNGFDGVSNIQCGGQLGSKVQSGLSVSSQNQCKTVASALNTLDGVSNVQCGHNNYLRIVPDTSTCEKYTAVLNSQLQSAMSPAKQTSSSHHAAGVEDVVTASLKKVQDADACPVPELDHSQFASHHELYKAVHESAFPACIAGSWIHQPGSRRVLSEEHLRCLDQERQGNCHDPDAWKHTEDPAKLSRHTSMLKKALLNSPGILNASDPWVWTSDLEQYKALPMDNRGDYISRVRKLFGGGAVTIFFVGDSLTRQWSHAMKCELEHVVGIPPDRVERTIRYLQMHVGWDDQLLLKRYQDPFRNATKRDYVVFNFGHHVGKKLGKDWPSEYARIMEGAFRVDFGRIPDHHVFFRTTTVRHFLANQGDWNTENSKAGGIQTKPEAQWSWYGGNSPELPMQNLLAFDAFLAPGRHFRILDTSPMMLSRADASFDGNHFCLPGPMDFWSRMLYYQMEQ